VCLRKSVGGVDWVPGKKPTLADQNWAREFAIQKRGGTWTYDWQEMGGDMVDNYPDSPSVKKKKIICFWVMGTPNFQ